MRVALLTPNAQAGDAIGNQVAEKVAFFVDRGADVRVFVESLKRLHPALGPHALLLSTAEAQGDHWQFLCSADLIVIEYGQAFGLLQLLPLLAGRKPRLLLDYHGVTPGELWEAHNREGLEQGAQQRGLVWCAEAAVVHSQFTARELQESTGFPWERLHGLGHPVDLGQFSPGPPCFDLRQQLGLGQATLLLFVGRLAPNKRLPVLVEAVHRLRELSPPVHAVVIGDQSDLYEREARRCRERAAQLGVADRLHVLGHLRQEQLLDAYRSADLFVMPSRHEGFCIPVLEAMACGVPVVAARAGALPETVGGAGLTFTPDDADDLARQIRRVLSSKTEERDARSTQRRGLRVAVVSFRYGLDFVGGAETSLRVMAQALQQAGHHVEVFTTCTTEENDWSNQLPEGTVQIAGVPVHRFRLDPHDRARHLESHRVLVQAEGPMPDDAEQAYVTHSIHSTRLLEALRQRVAEFDAILVGPYLFGLTLDVAQAFATKTLLVPCFHDEPLARLRLWREVYGRVGGILYHSPEEQALAQTHLGLNHPSSWCVGTYVDAPARGDPERGRRRAGVLRPYLLYCGRYSQEKNLPLLLDYARRYTERHPKRFPFVFVGQGQVTIPRESWVRDLGFVDEATKRDLLAGAAALVQLSRHESLSLSALEGWAQGTPLIADAGCAVLVGHLCRCGAGRAVSDFEAFAAALDDLWQEPQQWQSLGRQGQEYVTQQYGQCAAYTGCLVDAVGDLVVPLAERMRRRGLERAAEHERLRWRERFGQLVEELLDAPARPCREQIDVCPRMPTRTVGAGQEALLVPVRAHNHGTHPVVHEGPARHVLRCQVFHQNGQTCGTQVTATPLPGILVPGQAQAGVVPVAVPAVPGIYHVRFWAERAAEGGRRAMSDAEAFAVPCTTPSTGESFPSQGILRLVVEEAANSVETACCSPLLRAVHAALREAEHRQRLPDDYLDVTEGLFATWKRRLKQKLLGNFKRAYVDVLSRQQSAFNRHILTALLELAECCATLDHARHVAKDTTITERCFQGTEAPSAAALGALRSALQAVRTTVTTLEERLARLEEQVAVKEEMDS